jgi:hypothetical protein
MYYNHQLRTNLQEWKNRLYKCEFEDFKHDYLFFYDRLNKESILKIILDDIINDYPITNKELEKWMEQLYYDKTEYIDKRHKLSYLVHTCKYFFDLKDVPTYDNVFHGSAQENNQSFLNRMITPIVNYLQESLDNVNYILYILNKYKLRTEWFTKDTLKEKYANARNKKRYEQIFEDDIRLFLFDQGIDYPFPTPKSASGRADVVSLVDTEDPLVMEIKIFDSEKGYKKDRIIIGFTQIVKYANDYHKDVGYLVIFNLDNIEIKIENTESDGKWPNRVIFNGKTYYFIIINLNYDVSASNQKTLKTIEITSNDLSLSLQ